MTNNEESPTPWQTLSDVAQEMSRIGVTEKQFESIPNYHTTRLKNVRGLRDRYHMAIDTLLLLDMSARVQTLRTWFLTFDADIEGRQAALEKMPAAGDAFYDLRIHHARVRLTTSMHQKRSAMELLGLTQALTQLLPPDMVGALSVLPRQTWVDVYTKNADLGITPLDLESPT